MTANRAFRFRAAQAALEAAQAAGESGTRLALCEAQLAVLREPRNKRLRAALNGLRQLYEAETALETAQRRGASGKELALWEARLAAAHNPQDGGLAARAAELARLQDAQRLCDVTARWRAAGGSRGLHEAIAAAMADPDDPALTARRAGLERLIDLQRRGVRQAAQSVPGASDAEREYHRAMEMTLRGRFVTELPPQMEMLVDLWTAERQARDTALAAGVPPPHRSRTSTPTVRNRRGRSTRPR